MINTLDTMKFTLIKFFILAILPLELFSQGSNMDYERVKIGQAKQIICGMDLSPDHSYLAISSTQSFPFYEFDWKTRK